MKKLFAVLVFSALAVPSFAQLSATDPFFMLQKKGMLLDSELSYDNNYQGGDGAKQWLLKETFRYGLDPRWEVYGSLGIANLKMDGGYSETALTDPDFGVKYRASENLANRGLLLDLSAHLSPSLFDSPWDNHPDGVAKGSTDFGVKAMVGQEARSYKEWTWGGFAALDFIGSTDQGKSATDFYVGGVGKYYMDKVSSIDAEASLGFLGKRFDGDDSDTTLRLAGGYSRVLTSDLDLSGLLGFATHSADGDKTEIFLAARLRWRI